MKNEYIVFEKSKINDLIIKRNLGLQLVKKDFLAIFPFLNLIKECNHDELEKINDNQNSNSVSLLKLVESCISFHPLQDNKELFELFKIIYFLTPKISVEIGRGNGGTLLGICQLTKDNGLIISIDTSEVDKNQIGSDFYNRLDYLKKYYNKNYEVFYERFEIECFKKFKRLKQEIFFLDSGASSITTLSEVDLILRGQGIDFLFIDGDHRYSEVKKDFELYWPYINSGGIVAIHDIKNDHSGISVEVKKFWDEIKLLHNSREILSDNFSEKKSGIGLIFKK